MTCPRQWFYEIIVSNETASITTVPDKILESMHISIEHAVKNGTFTKSPIKKYERDKE